MKSFQEEGKDCRDSGNPIDIICGNQMVKLNKKRG
jgi:hypothetical protein